MAEAAAGGVSYESAGAGGSTRGAILGVRRDGPIWFYLSSGIPLDAAGLPWAAVGLGGRSGMPFSGVEIGVDWAANAHGYRAAELSATGAGGLFQALPYIAIDLSNARIEARSGLAHYSSSFAGETTSNSAHESGLSAQFTPHSGLAVSGEIRLLGTRDGDYPYAGAAAELTVPRGALWAYAGRWASDLLPAPVWGLGASVDIGARVALRASFQQEATDPLFWNETRRFWSVGVSRRLGARASPPLPAVTPETAPGGVVFRIPASSAREAPGVAGDFNGWIAVPMHRARDEWVVTIPVPPGVYHYAFASADGVWFVPDTIPNRVDDGFGGTNAVLVVPPGSS
jgi:hypothetical protein